MKELLAAWRQVQDAVTGHPLCRFTILPAGILLAIWLSGLSLVMLMWGLGGWEAWPLDEVVKGLNNEVFIVFILAGVGLAGGWLTGRWMPVVAGLATTVFALDTYVSEIKGWTYYYNSCSGLSSPGLLWLLVFCLAGLWLLFMDWRKPSGQPPLTWRLKLLVGVAAGILLLAGLMLAGLDTEPLRTEILLSLAAAVWFTVFFNLAWRLTAGPIFFCVFAVGVIGLCALQFPAVHHQLAWLAGSLAILSCLPLDTWLQPRQVPTEAGRRLTLSEKVALAGFLAPVVLLALLGLGSLKVVATQRLFAVCETGTPEQVRKACGFWTSVNARNRKEYTPLMLATISNPHSQVIAVLRQAGADVNAQSYGSSPLVMAIACQKPAMLAALIQAGAKVNAEFYGGRGWEEGRLWPSDLNPYDPVTPLMIAVNDIGNAEIVKLLLQAGAEVNARTQNGLTPLMIAAKVNRNPEIAQLLLQAGAEVNAKDKAGQSALDYAVASRNSKIVDLLRK